MLSPDFEDVTELAGEEISWEQLFRLCNRYYWAGTYCRGKDVLEVACGTGPGLGYLDGLARSVTAGDISAAIVKRAQSHYQNRMNISKFDASSTGFDDNSFDVIIIFEALYYVPDPDRFVRECKRLLRPGGCVLVSNANKDLYDFSPSPHSFVYHGVLELKELFERHGYTTEFFGSTPISRVSLRQRILRPIKAAVVKMDLMPKSMRGKRLLKRLVFGTPISMPAEITGDMVPIEAPTPLSSNAVEKNHKVIYCRAMLNQT